jgi:hypothetical protein
MVIDTMITLAIIGSRGFGEPGFRDVAWRKVYNFVINLPSGWRIVSGGAVGPDTWGVAAARDYGRPFIEHLPRYDLYPAKTALMERNKLIVQDADLVIGFWDGNSSGTMDAFSRAVRAGKRGGLVRLDDHCPTVDELRAMLPLPRAVSPSDG